MAVYIWPAVQSQSIACRAMRDFSHSSPSSEISQIQARIGEPELVLERLLLDREAIDHLAAAAAGGAPADALGLEQHHAIAALGERRAPQRSRRSRRR